MPLADNVILFSRLPNYLTVARLMAIPLFCLCFMLPFPGHRWWACLIFLGAALTDWLDGYLARRWDQRSRFGAFLDPVADKLLVSAALVLLVEAYQQAAITVPALVIVGREVAVSALREWLAENRTADHRVHTPAADLALPVTRLAQWKTAFQMVAIVVLLAAIACTPQTVWAYGGYGLGLVGLWAGAWLTGWSMYRYLRQSWAYLS